MNYPFVQAANGPSRGPSARGDPYTPLP